MTRHESADAEDGWVEATGAARARPAAARTRPSKKQQLIRLPSAKAGADVATIGRKLGWQPHTVRAA